MVTSRSTRGKYACLLIKAAFLGVEKEALSPPWAHMAWREETHHLVYQPLETGCSGMVARAAFQATPSYTPGCGQL